MNGHQRAFIRTTRLVAVALLLMAGLTGQAEAQRKSYTLDDDPLRLGDKALAAGRLEEARSLFSEAVANDHHVPDALCRLAVVDLRQGLFPEAEVHYRQAMAASGGHNASARAGLGLLLLRQGDKEGATAEFIQALEIDAKLWEAHYGLALQAMASSNWDAARQHLEFGRNERGVDKGEDKYQYGLALLLLGTGDLSEAEHAALRAQVLNPADPQYAQLVARIYQEEGHNALAISAYEAALATPGLVPTAPFLHELGLLYEEEKRFNEASERYLQAVTADSTYAPAMKDLAVLYQRAGRFDKAAGTLLRYVDLVPGDLGARLDLSDCFLELGRFDEAAAAAGIAWSQGLDDRMAGYKFATAGIQAHSDTLRDHAAEVMISLLNEPADDYSWQANDLLELAAWQSDHQDYEGARITLTRAEGLAPEDSRIPFQLGLAELAAGRAPEAVEQFQKAATLDPDAPANFLNLGIARYQAGQVEESIPAFRQAAALRPDLVITRLLLAQALAATGSLPDAEKEYRGILDLEPRNAKALRGVGFCRLRAADYSGAVKAYAQATEADPANADGWAGLGSARLGAGNLDAAEVAFAKARAIDPQNIMLKTGTQLLDQARNGGKENQ